MRTYTLLNAIFIVFAVMGAYLAYAQCDTSKLSEEEAIKLLEELKNIPHIVQSVKVAKLAKEIHDMNIRVVLGTNLGITEENSEGHTEQPKATEFYIYSPKDDSKAKGSMHVTPNSKEQQNVVYRFGFNAIPDELKGMDLSGFEGEMEDDEKLFKVLAPIEQKYLEYYLSSPINLLTKAQTKYIGLTQNSLLRWRTHRNAATNGNENNIYNKKVHGIINGTREGRNIKVQVLAKEIPQGYLELFEAFFTLVLLPKDHVWVKQIANNDAIDRVVKYINSDERKAMQEGVRKRFAWRIYPSSSTTETMPTIIPQYAHKIKPVGDPFGFMNFDFNNTVQLYDNTVSRALTFEDETDSEEKGKKRKPTKRAPSAKKRQKINREKE